MVREAEVVEDPNEESFQTYNKNVNVAILYLRGPKKPYVGSESGDSKRRLDLYFRVNDEKKNSFCTGSVAVARARTHVRAWRNAHRRMTWSHFNFHRRMTWTHREPGAPFMSSLQLPAGRSAKFSGGLHGRAAGQMPHCVSVGGLPGGRPMEHTARRWHVLRCPPRGRVDLRTK